ncbi:oligopeptide/dipeptide ABC transporter ATP-binding protein [Cumulibacter manganitolerans]|nr:oligopeptide/dipeptide ABC transporter ATP-binding protein [Cumulibacter manganitolerans]
MSIRAQILNLLIDLREETNLAYIFISHDMSAVHHVADRILVMYLGRPMELADRDALHEQTRHPYTAALLSAIPVPDPDVEQHRERVLLRGEIPSPLHPPSGCVFRTRCPIAQERCATERPEWRDVGFAGEPHLVACHYPLDPGAASAETQLKSHQPKGEQ